MAVAEIRFSTAVDPKGFEKGVEALGDKTDGLEKSLNRVTGAIDRAFQAEGIEDTSAAIMKQQTVVDALLQKMSDLATLESGGAYFQDLQGQFEKAAAEAKRFEDEVDAAARKVDELTEIGFSPDQLEEYIQTLDQAVAKFGDAENRAKALGDQLEGVDMPKQPKESAEELSTKLAIATKKLDEMKSKASAAGNETASGMKKAAGEAKNTAASMEGLSRSAEKTVTRIKSLAVGVFVFNVLRSSLKQFREYLVGALMENEAFARSFNQFKANVTAAVQPIINALIPALTRAADVFAYISGVILQIVAQLTNQNVAQLYAQAKARDKNTREKEAAHAKEMEAHAAAMSKESERAAAFQKKEQEKYDKEMKKRADAQAKAAEKQAKAEQKFAEKLKKSNEEAKKTTASFDDLITLASDTPDDTETLEMPEAEELEFEDYQWGIYDAIYTGTVEALAAGIYDGLSEPKELTQKVKDLVGLIMAIGGALLIVLGVILLFTGNIPIGLGLIVAGAILMYTALSPMWGSLSKDIQGVITIILGIIGIALIVIGAILCFSGANLPLGIALLVLGAVMFATAIAMGWKQLPDEIKGVISIIMAIVSVALIVIGIIILAGTGPNPLGLALLIAGAVMLVSTVALNFNAIKDFVKNNIELLMAIVGGALLVLGFILAMVGVVMPLAIALIIAGAGLLISAVALKWGSMSDETKGIISLIMGLVGAALLVLGIILCATGVALPLGIALIAVGAAALVSTIALNKDAIIDWIKGILEKIKELWGKFTDWLSEKWDGFKEWFFGTLDKIGDFFGNLWDGMVGIGKSAINGIINFVNGLISSVANGINFIIRALNKLSFDVPDWVPGIGGQTFGFSIPEVVPPQIPLLARGAVLPGGAPFMAVVNDQPRGQTNIEAPLATIEEALENVFARNADTLSGAYIVGVDAGAMTGFFRNMRFELKRADQMASAFAG